MIFVEQKLKRILKQKKPDVALRELAIELGFSLESTYETSGKHIESVVVSRIREASRSQRDAHMYWIAVFAAAASVISTFAAWSAVWESKQKIQNQRVEPTPLVASQISQTNKAESAHP